MDHALPSERVLPKFSNLVRLAWPIVISRSTQAVVGLADALMVAHLGEGALAATTTGAMNCMALFILPMGTVFIVGTFAAQYFGKGDPGGARRFVWYGLSVATIAQVLVVAALPLVAPALGLVGLAAEVRDLLARYMAVRLMSMLAVVGAEALGNYYGGLGRTRLPMVANVVAMVLNVAGNWLLIDGNLGMPALGVVGAAWASTLASAGGFLLLLGIFLYEGRGREVLSTLRLAELGKTLRFGFPAGLNWFFEFFAYIFFVNVVVGGLGTTTLAALMAVMQINTIAFMPSFAVASAGSIIVGQAIGARAPEDVPATVRLTFSATGGWQGLVGVMFLLIPELLFSPFAGGRDNPALLAAGGRMLMMSAAWQLFDAAATTLAEALRAAGDTAFTMWARLALSWLFFVPGAYVTVRVLGGGELLAMAWLTGYVALLGATLLWRFRSGVWKTFDLVESAQPAV